MAHHHHEIDFRSKCKQVYFHVGMITVIRGRNDLVHSLDRPSCKTVLLGDFRTLEIGELEVKASIK